MIIWPSWGTGLYLIARYFYLFNYDEKYSNEVINLSRGMLITCACSVSTVLKKTPAQTELPPNVLSQDRVWNLVHSEVPQAPGNTWLKTMKLIWSSLQWMYFYPRNESRMHFPQSLYKRVKLHVLPPSHPSTTTTHTRTHKLQVGCSQRKYGMAVQFEFQIMNNFCISMSQILYQKITYCLSETQI